VHAHDRGRLREQIILHNPWLIDRKCAGHMARADQAELCIHPDLALARVLRSLKKIP
jgi:hypothetical protein